MSKATGVKGKTPAVLARSRTALQRQAARDVRTAEEQAALLDTRPGQSARERARLTSQTETT